MDGERDDEREALNPQETGLALGVCTSTVYELLKSGELDSFKVGRARRIPRTSIRSFIHRNTVDRRGIGRGKR